MEAYKNIVEKVLADGEVKENRTGTNTIAVTGCMFEHYMSEGFPLLTTKYVPFRLVAIELEGFIKGITDKEWYQDRGCHIWDQWCNPEKVPYGHDAKTKAKMKQERDLGPIYGFQWRHFGSLYGNYNSTDWHHGIDQLKIVVDTLKTNPNDRRMIVTAWSPAFLRKMALHPCHYAFQVTVTNGRLNLLWNQRKQYCA